MATQHNFRIKNGLEVGGVLIVNSSGQLVVADISANQKFLDNVKLRFGNSSDLQIYHNGSNSYIDDVGTGALNIRSSALFVEKQDGSEVMASFIADGAVSLYYDSDAKLITTTAGVQIPSQSGTIGWSNLANAWLLLGTSSAGIGIDNNEIMAKGVGSLYLGTADAGSDVIIRAGGTSARITIAASDGEVTIPGDLSVGGDLNITGDINSVSVTDLDVVDKTITLGKGQTEGNSGGSGIVIDGSGAQMLWDEVDNRFEFNKNLHSTGNIISSAGTSQFYGAQVNSGGLKVHGGGTYTDPGSQMYLYADASGHGYLAVHDLYFYVGSNNSRTVQALKLTSTGDAHLKDNAILQWGNSSHYIQGGASSGGGDMTIGAADDIHLKSRYIRFTDTVGSAGEYARIAHNGSWIYTNLTTRNHVPQTDSTYYLGASGNEWAGAYIDTGVFGSLDVSGNVDIDGTLETDGLTVNGNALYVKDETTASVAGAGYYRVAANTVGGSGRGAFICTVYTTGGSYAPREVVIQGHADWSSTETIHTVKSSAANTYFTKARIVRESGDAFLEVYFYGAITDLEIETVAVGHAGWYSLSGALTAATGTETRTGPVTLIAPGLNTQDVVNATQGFQVNNQTVIDNSRNIENITTITTEGTATSGTIMDIRPSDTNQMFRVRFPDSSTMEMGTTRAGNGNVQKAVVYGQGGVDITTNGVLRASMTQAGDFSLDADCGGLYFGGSTRSSTTNAQTYIKESGLNLDIKGNDNVRLLGDGGNVILHADYTGRVSVGNGVTAGASILHVKGTQSYGSLRISPTSTNGESAMAFFLDTAGTATNTAWVVGHAGWGNTGDFVIGNQAFGGPVMLMQQDGKVGIGTLAPASVLDVRASLGANGTAATSTAYFINNTSGATSGSIYIGASAGVDWKIGKNVTGISGNTNFSIADSSNNRRFDIDGSGNVGIGTSSPYGATHWQKSSTVNLVATNSGADGQTDTTVMSLIGQARGYGNNLAKLASIDFKTDPTTWYYGAITFNVANLDGTDTSRTPLEAMRINRLGNVGIGTSAPNSYTNQTALTINGTTHSRVDLEVGGVLKGNIHVDSGSINVDAGANKVRFYAGNSERARISSTGRLHVNHTNDPGWDSLGTLVVRQISDDIVICIVDDLSQNTFKLLNNGTFAELNYNVDLPMIFTTGTGAGTERMRINAGGNVSIGSFGTPDAKLHVDGAVIVGGNENKATTPIAGLHVIDDSYSQWHQILGPRAAALRVEAYWKGNNAHDRAIGDYAGGIAFNILGGHSTTHDDNMHGWIGPRVWDTPGRERSALVFATNNDTSTQPSESTATILERMCITPAGLVGIANKNPGYLLEVGDASQTNSNIFSGRVNGDFIFNLSKATTNLFSIRNNSTSIVHLNTNNSAALSLGVSTSTGTGTLQNDLNINTINIEANKQLKVKAGAGFFIGPSGGVYERYFNSSYAPHNTANQMYKLNLGNSGGLSGVLEITVQGTYSHQDVSGYVKRTTNIGLNQNGSAWRNDLISVEQYGRAADQIVIGPVQWDSSASQYYVNIYKINGNGNGYTVGAKLTTDSGSDGGFRTWTLSNHATLAAPTGYTSRYDTNARPQNVNRQRITDTSSEALRVDGHVHAAEYNLPSGGMLDWANGDARIIEGDGENYSLSLQTYDGSNVNTNTRFDGDNSVHHFGNEFSFLNNKIDMHYNSTPNGLSNVPTMRIGDYGRGVEELQFNVSNNGTARICFKDNNWSEGSFIKAVGQAGGSKIHFGSMWNTETDLITMDLAQSVGKLGVNTSGPDYTLDVNGDVGINEYIYHNGDNDTYWRFQSDRIDIRAGGSDTITVKPTQLDINQSAKYSGFSTAGAQNRDQAIYIGRDQTDASAEYFTMGFKTTCRSGEQMHPTNGPYNGGSAFYMECGSSEAGGICLDQDSVQVYGSSDSGSTFRVIDKDSDIVTFEMKQTTWEGVFRGNVTAFGSMSSISDRRIKENIEPIEPVIEKIKNVGVYKYNKITAPEAYKDRKEIGVIAQEIQKEFPDLVNEETVDPEKTYGLDTILSVDYEHLTAVLLKGMQEQQDQIDSMKKQIEELTSKHNGE